MDAIQHKFPGVHWIIYGAICYVYEVHPRIAVKVPKSGEYEQEQFKKELEIYRLFSRHQPCPSIVQCFHISEKGLFLEYMKDKSLYTRLKGYCERDETLRVVTKVTKLEPLPIRKEWMNDLAKAVAFLESLNLAHGDLNPSNILVDRTRVKLSDFDWTAEFGTTCENPGRYGRWLNSNDPEYGENGMCGSLGPRTEQFALGSIYYFINYGFEVYEDRCLTPEDPREHGPKAAELLQNMEFPKLDCNPQIDEIIHKCWHNQYATVAELAVDTQRLVNEERGTNGEVAIPEQTNGENCDEAGPNSFGEGLSSEREFCEDLEKRGLLDLLCSDEPEKLGFKLGWYRYSLDEQ